MAGSGWRVFEAGEVLTAANTQNYLQDQVVQVYSGTAARGSALGTALSEGMMSYLEDANIVQVYDGTNWVEISGGGGVTIGTAAPGSPDAGDLWWDSDDGKLFLYYDDGSSSQWVDAAGPSVAVQATAPTGYEGQLWLDSTDGSMYTYYTDPGGTASSWIGAVSRSGGILQVVSTTKTDTFSASVASGSSSAVTGLTASITPRSTSSKIMILATVSGDGPDSLAILPTRGGSSIAGALGAADGSRGRVTSGNGDDAGLNQIGISATLQFLDSPSSTSSLTYGINVFNTASGTQTLYVNRTVGDGNLGYVPRFSSTITLIEVAG